jgi:hypothetical protein
MATITKEEISSSAETTADEKEGVVDSSSNNSSDVELDYDANHNILKAKYNDKIIDMRFNKDCKTKQEALNKMLLKYLASIETQRKRSAEYYKKIQGNGETKQNTKDAKAQWFQNNKERLRQQQADKYNNDHEYRQRVIDKTKRAYNKRTDGVEKQKRGRKPLDKTDATELIKKRRGRPPKKTLTI